MLKVIERPIAIDDVIPAERAHIDGKVKIENSHIVAREAFLDGCNIGRIAIRDRDGTVPVQKELRMQAYASPYFLGRSSPKGPVQKSRGGPVSPC